MENMRKTVVVMPLANEEILTLNFDDLCVYAILDGVNVNITM